MLKSCAINMISPVSSQMTEIEMARRSLKRVTVEMEPDLHAALVGIAADLDRGVGNLLRCLGRELVAKRRRQTAAVQRGVRRESRERAAA